MLTDPRFVDVSEARHDEPKSVASALRGYCFGLADGHGPLLSRCGREHCPREARSRRGNAISRIRRRTATRPTIAATAGQSRAAFPPLKPRSRQAATCFDPVSHRLLQCDASGGPARLPTRRCDSRHLQASPGFGDLRVAGSRARGRPAESPLCVRRPKSRRSSRDLRTNGRGSSHLFHVGCERFGLLAAAEALDALAADYLAGRFGAVEASLETD